MKSIAAGPLSWGAHGGALSICKLDLIQLQFPKTPFDFKSENHLAQHRKRDHRRRTFLMHRQRRDRPLSKPGDPDTNTTWHLSWQRFWGSQKGGFQKGALGPLCQKWNESTFSKTALLQNRHLVSSRKILGVRCAPCQPALWFRVFSNPACASTPSWAPTASATINRRATEITIDNTNNNSNTKSIRPT